MQSPCSPHEGHSLFQVLLNPELDYWATLITFDSSSGLISSHWILWAITLGIWGTGIPTTHPMGKCRVSSSITIGVCWKARHQINISQTSVCAWTSRCVLGYLHSLCHMSSWHYSGKLVSTKYSESLNSSTWNSPMCNFAHRVLRKEKGFWINLHSFSHRTLHFSQICDIGTRIFIRAILEYFSVPRKATNLHMKTLQDGEMAVSLTTLCFKGYLSSLLKLRLHHQVDTVCLQHLDTH